jgi:hypothetical protein
MAPLLIRLAILGLAAFLIYWLVTRVLFPKPRLKCATCRHCGRTVSGGVMCRFGEKEVFKNLIHIENCPSFEDDPRIPGPRP